MPPFAAGTSVSLEHGSHRHEALLDNFRGGAGRCFPSKPAGTLDGETTLPIQIQILDAIPSCKTGRPVPQLEDTLCLAVLHTGCHDSGDGREVGIDYDQLRSAGLDAEARTHHPRRHAGDGE